MRFTVDGGELFSFAALWTRTRIGDGLVESATMLDRRSTSRGRGRVAEPIRLSQPNAPGPCKENLKIAA